MQTPAGWVGRVIRLILVASLVAPTVYATAQHTVTIEVPGATKPIQGDLYGSGSSGVILAHGGGRTKESWRKEATDFTDAGFIVLAINFRGDSIDEIGRPISVGSDE